MGRSNVSEDEVDLSGDAIGWGLNLSSNLKLGKDNLVRLSVLYGAGVQNYMNDAPVDVAIDTNRRYEMELQYHYSVLLLFLNITGARNLQQQSVIQC